MAEVHGAVETIAATEDDSARSREGVTVLHGRAVFRSATELDVDGRTVRAGRFIVPSAPARQCRRRRPERHQSPIKQAALTDRRQLRASYGPFEDLDRQLGPERGRNGGPSRADFQTIELLRVVDPSPSGSTFSPS